MRGARPSATLDPPEGGGGMIPSLIPKHKPLPLPLNWLNEKFKNKAVIIITLMTDLG